MLFFIVPAIVIAGSMGIFLLMQWMKKVQKRKRIHRLLYHFSQLGSKKDLVFSSHELLDNYIIGVDGVHRKLLILDMNERVWKDYMIDLNEISSCQLKKMYKVFYIDSERRNKKKNIERIVLSFEHPSDSSFVQIPFYNALENRPNQLFSLEQKAKDWEVMLTKMLQAPSEIEKRLGY